MAAMSAARSSRHVLMRLTAAGNRVRMRCGHRRTAYRWTRPEADGRAASKVSVFKTGGRRLTSTLFLLAWQYNSSAMVLIGLFMPSACIAPGPEVGRKTQLRVFGGLIWWQHNSLLCSLIRGCAVQSSVVGSSSASASRVDVSSATILSAVYQSRISCWNVQCARTRRGASASPCAVQCSRHTALIGLILSQLFTSTLRHITNPQTLVQSHKQPHSKLLRINSITLSLFHHADRQCDASPSSRLRTPPAPSLD